MIINSIIWAGIFVLGHALFTFCPWWLIVTAVVVFGLAFGLVETDPAETLPTA